MYIVIGPKAHHFLISERACVKVRFPKRKKRKKSTAQTGTNKKKQAKRTSSTAKPMEDESGWINTNKPITQNSAATFTKRQGTNASTCRIIELLASSSSEEEDELTVVPKKRKKSRLKKIKSIPKQEEEDGDSSEFEF